MVGSGVLLIVFFLLFRAEKINNQYFLLAEKRAKLDSILDQKLQFIEKIVTLFGASSFRLFFHYLLHQLLGVVLYMINATEKYLHSLRKKNRVFAKSVENTKNDNHLTHIAKHKQSTTLSTEEREIRKDRSLND